MFSKTPASRNCARSQVSSPTRTRRNDYWSFLINNRNSTSRIQVSSSSSCIHLLQAGSCTVDVSSFCTIPSPQLVVLDHYFFPIEKLEVSLVIPHWAQNKNFIYDKNYKKIILSHSGALCSTIEIHIWIICVVAT